MTSPRSAVDPLARLDDIAERVRRCTPGEFARRKRLTVLRWAADDLLVQAVWNQALLDVAPSTPLAPVERQVIEDLLRQSGAGRHIPVFPEFIDRLSASDLTN